MGETQTERTSGLELRDYFRILSQRKWTAIFVFLLVWIINVALSARDRVGAVICVGVAAMTFWHVIVNVAMVLGIAPVVGVTLPFISYGGSSLVTFFLAMGLVANVSLRKHGY